MRYLPFCPEHGIRLHKKGFVYYNGIYKADKSEATRRNLIFNGDAYIENILNEELKQEANRLCYESNEDAVSWNVFTELLKTGSTLPKIVKLITGRNYSGAINLYLWGIRIDLAGRSFSQYKPLAKARALIEPDIKVFPTEPDIMLVIPGKLVICIEAKFGSKNPEAKEKEQVTSNKPTKISDIIDKYYFRNNLINKDNIFDLSNIPKPFYEQLFRNLVFAASMAKYEGNADWYVANLRSRHVMNLNPGRAESRPVMKNIRSILMPKYKKRFIHITWEDIYNTAVKDDPQLVNLAWYFKNKTLNCTRAFSVK